MKSVLHMKVTHTGRKGITNMTVNASQISRNSGHFQRWKSEPEWVSHFSLKSQVFHSFVGWTVLW